MDNLKKQLSASKLSYTVFGLLVVLLLAVLVWFVADIKNLYQTGSIRPHLHRRAMMQNVPQPTQIQGWMTFRYVNYIFNLPANYLSAKLNIKNSSYPNITISQYTAKEKLDSAVFIQSVKQAVGEYVVGGSK